MPLIEKSLSIGAPIDVVFRVSQDYAVRYEWDPFPEKIAVVNGSPEVSGIGTQVLVRSKLGMEMVVEFVQFAPPDRAAIKMVSGPALIDKFAGSWIFDEAGPGNTLARFRYAIAMRPAWLAWAFNWFAITYFSRTAEKRLAGLKRYCESLA
jgi:hypothetical protein